MADQEQLFDAGDYHEPEHPIVKILDYPLNTILGVKDYYRVCPHEMIQTYYGYGNGEVSTSATYDRGPSQWAAYTHNPGDLLEGFLRGLPTIETPKGKSIAMHLFSMWDDVDGSSIIVPLNDIDEIYRFDPLYAQLMAHEHDISDGFNVKSRKYEVPILRIKESGEWICRAAEAGDMEQARTELDLPIIQIYGQGSFSNNPAKPEKFYT